MHRGHFAVSAPLLASVAIVPAGDGWAVILNRPARAEVLRTFPDRAQAMAQAAQLAAMLDLPMLTVGSEPEEASGTPVPQLVR